METVFSMESCFWCSFLKLRFSSSHSKKSGAITAIIDGDESLTLQEPAKYSPMGSLCCLCLVQAVSVLPGVLLVPSERAVTAF